MVDLLVNYPRPEPRGTFASSRKAVSTKFSRAYSSVRMGLEVEKALRASSRGKQLSLLEAIREGLSEPALIQMLAKGSVDPEEQSGHGRTPLHAAAKRNFRQLVRKLLDAEPQGPKAGNRLDAEDDMGFTPLIDAAREGHKEVVAELIDRGAFIHAKTTQGSTALDWARFGNHLEAAELLTKELDRQKNLGGGPAAGGGKPSSSTNKLASSTTNKPGEKPGGRQKFKDGGWTDVMSAAFAGDAVALIEALSRGLSAERLRSMKTQHGDTPLHMAARTGSKECCKILIEAKAMINARNLAGLSALVSAANRGHENVVELLLEKGAPVEDGDWEYADFRADAERKSQAAVAAELRKSGTGVELGAGAGRSMRRSFLRQQSSLQRQANAQPRLSTGTDLARFADFICEHFSGTQQAVGCEVSRRASVRHRRLKDAMKMAFNVIDDNNSQSISSFEFERGIRSLGYPGDAKALFRLIDEDNDGALELQELMRIVDDLVYGDTDKEAQELLASESLQSLTAQYSKSTLAPPVIQLRCWKFKLEAGDAKLDHAWGLRLVTIDHAGRLRYHSESEGKSVPMMHGHSVGGLVIQPLDFSEETCKRYTLMFSPPSGDEDEDEVVLGFDSERDVERFLRAVDVFRPEGKKALIDIGYEFKLSCVTKAYT